VRACAKLADKFMSALKHHKPLVIYFIFLLYT